MARFDGAATGGVADYREARPQKLRVGQGVFGGIVPSDAPAAMGAIVLQRAGMESVVTNRTNTWTGHWAVVAAAVASCSIGACSQEAAGLPHENARAHAEAKASDEDLECVEIINTSTCWHDRCNHMVTLTNHCRTPVDCDVASDVEPGWVRVHLDAGQASQLTLRYSADGDEFEIRRKCWHYD